MKPLTDTPDEMFIIGDDDEVTARIVELELYETLKAAQKKVPVDIVKGGFRIYKYDHATHWIAVDYFTGFERPADNGFVITAAPKSRYSRAEFDHLLPQEFNFKKVHFMEHWPANLPKN